MSTIALPTSAYRKRSRCYWETRSDLKQLKATILKKKKTHFLLRILAVIGRSGPPLTIVMIFVTQDNFKNGPGISDRLLGFYQEIKKKKKSIKISLVFITVCF